MMLPSVVGGSHHDRDVFRYQNHETMSLGLKAEQKDDALCSLGRASLKATQASPEDPRQPFESYVHGSQHPPLPVQWI